MKKIFVLVLAIIAMLALFTACSSVSAEDSSDYSEYLADENVNAEIDEVLTTEAKENEIDSEMKIHFIDVGQGDCTFIDYGEYEALVDCGKESYSKSVVEYISPYVDGDLDLIIATHPDSDHIGGMDYVLDSFSVSSVIDSGAVKDTATYRDYFSAVERQADCNYSGDDNCIIYMDKAGDANIKIIETGDENKDVNEVSVVAQVNYKDISVLLTGDMGQKTEKSNLDKFEKVDVLKAAHHGSSKSSSKEFLEKIHPDYVIISVGANNSYGHPSEEALQRFSDIGATVYQTMNSGTIIMKTDGNTYKFENTGSIDVKEPESEETYTTGTSDNKDESISYSSYLGSKNSNKFHLSSCTYAKRISENNRIYFNSREEALNSGYSPCSVCNP